MTQQHQTSVIAAKCHHHHHQPFYNADKPGNAGSTASGILFDPKRRLMRNYCSAALLLCSSITTTTTSMAVLLSMRGGDAGTTGGMSTTTNNKQYRLLQSTIIHRHGDRTPITPLKDEDYWKATLPTPETLQKIANGTVTQRLSSQAPHTAKGRGPFGKLTQLGISQMISVGNQLKEIFHDNDLQPQDIRVISTDFPRTIQSVQAVLLGLFPDKNDMSNKIVIDCRHTNWMIPDPQPRNRPEQNQLETELIHRPHMIQKEQEMHALGVKCTKALLPLLAKDAFDMKIGIGVNNDDEPEAARVLPWVQLAEITKCLQVRDKLPKEITLQDQQALSNHLAWRWFQSLRDKRLAQLAMGKFASEIIRSMTTATTQPQKQQQHKLTIYSCHDSSLIGLICAFGLKNPSVWPEYGSFLKVDLLESNTNSKNNKVVQFSLNGERLHWHNGQDEIPLEILKQYVNFAPQ